MLHAGYTETVILRSHQMTTALVFNFCLQGSFNLRNKLRPIERYHGPPVERDRKIQTQDENGEDDFATQEARLA